MWDPYDEICVIKSGRTRVVSITPCHVRIQKEGGCVHTRQQILTRHQVCQQFILAFPASRFVI